MCDPITLALMAGAVVSSVAGTKIAGNEASQQVADITRARNKVLNQTLAKNKEHADRSRELFDSRVTDIGDNASTDIAQSQTDRTANIQANISEAAPSQSAVMPTSAPTVVKSALAKKMSDIFSESTEQAKRTGALTGYGGFFSDQAIADASAGRDVGVNADAISGNMRLMPSLQDFAQIRATKPSSGLGQMLQALGSMMGSAAGAGIGGLPGGAGGEGFLRPNLNLKGPGGTLGGGV